MLINYSEKIKQFNKKIVEKFDQHLHKMFADKLASSRPYPIKKFDAHLHKTFGLSSSQQNGEHEYVDLGLPSGTLWATMNIGANSPEEPGLYFAWGETKGYDPYEYEHSFNHASYKWCNGSDTTLTKYCNDSDYGYNGFTDTLTELEPEDDAAYVNWGSEWRIPSKEEWEELCNYCIPTMIFDKYGNGLYFMCTSNINEKSIILPLTGIAQNEDITSYNSAYNWSRDLYVNEDSGEGAWVAHAVFNCEPDFLGRDYGLPIRPVKAQQ